jgi:hypothetical protein
MAAFIKTGGTWTEIVAPQVKTGDAWALAQAVYVRTGGVWELVWQGFTVEASPDTLNAQDFSTTVTSGVCTVTPTGGSGSYTYAWSQVSGDLITILNPTGASTAFRGSTMEPGESRSGVFVCAVTDTGSGAEAETNQVSVNLTSLL